MGNRKINVDEVLNYIHSINPTNCKTKKEEDLHLKVGQSAIYMRFQYRSPLFMIMMNTLVNIIGRFSEQKNVDVHFTTCVESTCTAKFAGAD